MSLLLQERAACVLWPKTLSSTPAAEGSGLRPRFGSENPEGRWHFEEGPGSYPRTFLFAPGNDSLSAIIEKIGQPKR